MALPPIYPENPFLDKDEYTEDEYLAWEERAPGRWEWVPSGISDTQGQDLGRIVAMSGGTLEHAEIAGNLLTALKIALRGVGVQMCRVFGSDLKVRAGDGRNTYPDVSVICGKPNFHGGRRDEPDSRCRSAVAVHGGQRSLGQVGELPDDSHASVLPADCAGLGARGGLYPRRFGVAF